jgi:excisionase family DNA binding protein
MSTLNQILIPIMEQLDKIEHIVTNNQVSKMMTIKDIVLYASLSESTIRRHIHKGKLKPFKEYGKKLFRKVDVDKWLKG